MTNRDKFNSIYNDVLADMLYAIKGDDVRCKFCAYTKGDCFGKSCFDGVKSWLNSYRDKFDEMSNAELVNILKQTAVGDKCQFCCYTSGGCFGKSCADGIEMWLSAPCANEPKNPPADNKAGKLSKKSETVFMTNGDKIKSMNNAELAKVLVKGEWCDGCEGCALKICSTEECVELVRMWLEKKCKDNPPADKHVDLQKVSEKVCDNVNHPSHYTSGKIEVIDFIEDKELGFHLGNAVKYISRAGRKNPDKTVEDLRKAVWYINRQIERLERGKHE